MTLYYSILATACVVSFLTGTTLMIMAFVKDLKNELNCLNGMDTSKESEEKKYRQRLFEFVQFHSDSKQLSAANYLA